MNSFNICRKKKTVGGLDNNTKLVNAHISNTTEKSLIPFTRIKRPLGIKSAFESQIKFV